jgi:ribonuclease Z
VFTHIVQLASPTVAPPSIEEIMAQTRQAYDGPLMMGEDLMSFDIGDTVTMRRHCSASP